MKIGELSKRTNTPRETIHHYIREGLLRKPHKTGRNSANYTESHVETLRTIRNLREHYYMPLPEIKKYLTLAKKRSLTTLPLLDLKRMIDHFFNSVEQLFPPKVLGREAFASITGLSRELVSKLEEWGVIIPTVSDNQEIYTGRTVVIGRLIGELDRLGFEEKDGMEHYSFKKLVDFFRRDLLSHQQEVLTRKFGRGPLTAEQLMEASMHGTIVSLVVLYLFRRIDIEGYEYFLASISVEAPEENT